MTIVPKNQLGQGLLGLLPPPILMAYFHIAERSYTFYEVGGLFLLGILVICSLALSAICLARLIRTIRLWFTIPIIVVLASSPFWNSTIGIEPNAHGFSILMWFIHFVVACALSGYLLFVALRRLINGEDFGSNF